MTYQTSKKFKVKRMFGKQIKIPSEWNFEKITENSTLKGRIGWQGLTTSEYKNQGSFYLVTGTDFNNGKINWKSCVYVDKHRYEQDPNIQLRKFDVLVTKDGTIGKIAFIHDLPLAATLNSGIFVIRPIKNAYHSLFLYHVLASTYFKTFLNRLKAGSTINHLYQKDLLNFYFIVPTIHEQQKIASILSNVDALIESTQQIVDETKRLKMALGDKLLTRGLNHKKFKKVDWIFGKKLEVPINWKKDKLIHNCIKKPKYGANIAAMPKDPKLPRYIRITDINDDGKLKKQWMSISVKDSAGYMLAEHDFLFARTGSIGRTYLHTKRNGKCAFAGYLIKFTLNPTKLEPMFLFHYTHSRLYYKWIDYIQTLGVQPNINAQQYSNMPILIPCIDEQQKIASILSNIDACIQESKEYKEKLKRLKKSLMQKLLSGQVRVTT